jgi:hypothetical protein
MIKYLRRLVGCGFLAVALTVPLAACDTSDAGNPAAEADDTGTGGSPGIESSGPEDPRSPDDRPVVSYPDLPVGENTQQEQCLTVQWLGRTDVPDGVSVQVKGVRIDPGVVFEQPGRGCDGVQACTGSFAFTSADNSCSVALVATGKKGKREYLKVAGRCVPRDREQCGELLAEGGSSIPLNQPEEEPSPEENPPEENPPEENPPDENPPDDNPPDDSPPGENPPPGGN